MNLKAYISPRTRVILRSRLTQSILRLALLGLLIGPSETASISAAIDADPSDVQLHLQHHSVRDVPVCHASIHKRAPGADDSCCYGLKAFSAEGGGSVTKTEAPALAFVLPSTQGSLGAFKAMVRRMADSLLHQTSSPIYLATQRLRV